MIYVVNLVNAENRINGLFGYCRHQNIILYFLSTIRIYFPVMCYVSGVMRSRAWPRLSLSWQHRPPVTRDSSASGGSISHQPYSTINRKTYLMPRREAPDRVLWVSLLYQYKDAMLKMLEILSRITFFVGQRPSAPLAAWDHTSLGRHSGPRQSSVRARPHPGPEWPDISERPEPETWSPTSDVRLTSDCEAGDTGDRRRWGSAQSEVSAWQVWHHVTEGNECWETQLSSAPHCSGDLGDRETTLALAIIQCQWQ